MSTVYANASYVHGAFMLTPKPEAMDKIINEFATFSKHVETNEPGTISYNVNKAKPLDMEGNETGGPETIIVAMIFKDQAAMQAHRESPEQLKFAEKMKTYKDNMQAPPELRTLTPAGGFVMKN